MAENFASQDPWIQYEQLLDQHYPDLSDDWDMFEDTGKIQQLFTLGQTAREVFDAQHGWLFSQQVKQG